jgi:hypothetical protein
MWICGYFVRVQMASWVQDVAVITIITIMIIIITNFIYVDISCACRWPRGCKMLTK